MKTQHSVLAVLVFGLNLASVSAEPVQTDAVVKYLAAHAIPLESVQAGSGFEDLKPLETVLKDVNMVGLGEGTHGTREFFQFKHRMLEFLVQKMGFNVFALESSYVACLNINDYVMYGKGDPAAALASQKFWTWDTQEVSEMIEWLRQYNSKLPESQRVRFMGYDIQAYTQAFDVIGNYLKKVAPQYLAQAQEAFQPLNADPVAAKALAARTKAERDAETVRLQALMDFLVQNRSQFVAQSSGEEFDKVLQHARILIQYHSSYSKPEPGEAPGNRDLYMAENIRYLMDRPGAPVKMVVWAHNAHVADLGESGAASSMGHFLRQWYGPRYYILGFAFNEGSFQSLGKREGEERFFLQEFTVPAAPEDAVSWYLERARAGRKYQNYVIDFRSAPKTGPFAAWLATPLRLFSAGSSFSHDWALDQYMPVGVLGKEYDGMVFISKTTRARPNPTGMRPQPEQKKQ